MADSSQVLQLNTLISSYVTELEEHLKTKSLPSPSFSINTPAAYDLPPELAGKCQRALGALDDLKALLEGPRANLASTLNTRGGIYIALQAISRYHIHQHLAVDEELSYDELAKRCGLDVSMLRRVLRTAMTVRLFCEDRKGFVAHSPSSKILAQVPLIDVHLAFAFEELWSTSVRTVDAMQKWPDSEEPEHTGFALNNNGASLWNVMETDEARSERFAAAMKFLHFAPPFSHTHLVKALDWNQDNGPRNLVDIGGSQGSHAKSLLEHFSCLEHVVVQDLPEVVKNAIVPAELAGRLEFVAHNFFTEQTIEADAYLLRLILHDWSDKYAKLILQHLIPKLKAGAKIIVNDICLPERGQITKYHEQIMRSHDLMMRGLTNSKERDNDEWIKLFQSVDTRFKFNGIKQPPGSALAVIEFVWYS